MAGDMPMALRRTPRRQQHGVGETAAPRTPASTASQRRSPRVNAPRKPAATKNAMLPRTTAGKSVARRSNTKSKAGVAKSATAVADDATDDSVTLVDDDSITALDFDIPISSSQRSSSGANSSNTNKRKRLSTSSTTTTTSPAIKRARRQQTDNNTPNTSSSIIHILPLRTQILDDHIKRRIRRNGLSAEMNDAYGEKRARRQKTLAELRQARDELADRDAEIERLRELTALFDQHGSSHHDLEMEISRLREQVSGRQGRRRGGGEDEVPFSSSPPVARGDDDGWGAMGGMSDDGSDAGGDFDNDEEFGEASLAELESGGTPGHARQQQQRKPTGKRPTALHLHGPTLTPPSTSPAKLPSSPVRQIHSSGSSSSTACDAGMQAASVSADASSQACIPDPETAALHEELDTLRAEVSSLSDTLLERDSLQSRLGDKLAQHQQAGDDDSDVELQLDIVLQDLADKTARLGELSSLLTPSSSTTTVVDKEATAQLSSALQGVRDALADLDPSDTTVPQTATATLKLASTRLRELDTSLRQHKAELSTRETSLAAAEARAAAKDRTATNLSLDIAHLAETISSLREELDTLQEHSASQSLDLDSARDAALQSKTAAAEAESRLAEASARIAALSKKLSEREGALRDREGEVDRLRTELAEAGVTIAKLREGNAREVGRSREVVRAMRAQMVAALRMGDGFLGDVAETQNQGVAKEEVESVSGVDVEMDKADRGRSDDSGLGLDGEMQLV